MITGHSLWLYFHIMLVVLSIGPDIAVFAASYRAKNAELSVEARESLMRLGGFLDLFPRSSFALFLPVGLHLTLGLGLYPVTSMMLVIAWVIALSWIAMIFVIYRNEGKPLAFKLIMVQAVLEFVVGAVFVTVGGMSLLTEGPLVDTWFAVKMTLFGLMFWTALAVELAYRPLFIPYLEILEHGSTPERERLFTKYIHRAMFGVSVIYVEVACMAFLGVTKPFY
jgi:hypothetical protein